MTRFSITKTTRLALGCAGLILASSSISAADIRANAAETLVVCSPDATHLATVGQQGRIHYRKASDNTIQYTLYICHPQAVCFSEDGTVLAVAGGRNGSRAKIKVWRVSDHQQLCEIITSGVGFNAVALSADGRRLVAASTDGRVELWSVSDGQSQWSWTMSGAAKSIRFSPDSRRLLVRAENGNERQLDAVKGRPVTDQGP